jgi:beta-galactosidase/beta-glucuronidase
MGYVKWFDLDEHLRGKRVAIRFEGVEEAMYLYLNGSLSVTPKTASPPRSST